MTCSFTGNLFVFEAALMQDTSVTPESSDKHSRSCYPSRLGIPSQPFKGVIYKIWTLKVPSKTEEAATTYRP